MKTLLFLFATLSVLISSCRSPDSKSEAKEIVVGDQKAVILKEYGVDYLLQDRFAVSTGAKLCFGNGKIYDDISTYSVIWSVSLQDKCADSFNKLVNVVVFYSGPSGDLKKHGSSTVVGKVVNDGNLRLISLCTEEYSVACSVEVSSGRVYVKDYPNNKFRTVGTAKLNGQHACAELTAKPTTEERFVNSAENYYDFFWSDTKLWTNAISNSSFAFSFAKNELCEPSTETTSPNPAFINPDKVKEARGQKQTINFGGLCCTFKQMNPNK